MQRKFLQKRGGFLIFTYKYGQIYYKMIIFVGSQSLIWFNKMIHFINENTKSHPDPGWNKLRTSPTICLPSLWISGSLIHTPGLASLVCNHIYWNTTVKLKSITLDFSGKYVDFHDHSVVLLDRFYS